MTVEEATVAATQINEMLQAGNARGALAQATALRDRLRENVAMKPELLPNLQKVEQAIHQLQVAHAKTTSSTQPDSIEGMVVMSGSVLGILSVLGGGLTFIVGFFMLDSRLTEMRIFYCVLGVNAVLVGVFVSCVGRLLARNSAMLRALIERD